MRDVGAGDATDTERIRSIINNMDPIHSPTQEKWTDCLKDNYKARLGTRRLPEQSYIKKRNLLLKSFPQRKLQVQMALLISSETSKNKIIPNELFQEIEEKRILQSFY